MQSPATMDPLRQLGPPSYCFHSLPVAHPSMNLPVALMARHFLEATMHTAAGVSGTPQVHPDTAYDASTERRLPRVLQPGSMSQLAA